MSLCEKLFNQNKAILEAKQSYEQIIRKAMLFVTAF